MLSIRSMAVSLLAFGISALAWSQTDSSPKKAVAVTEALRAPIRKLYLYDGAAHDVPPSWGTSQVSFSRLGATELSPDGSGTTYSSTWNPPVMAYQRFVTGGFPHLIGYGHIPGGALLVQNDFVFCEQNSTGPYGSINVYLCDSGGGCLSAPLFTLDMGNYGTGCADIAAFYGGNAITMSNADNLILVDMQFAYTDGTESIGSVGFGYQLQVSPAPGSATFGDVPTSDPAFQYVEALVAAGITAGCGGGNYCPDAPLTRRQMAVFISKALGLSWAGY